MKSTTQLDMLHTDCFDKMCDCNGLTPSSMRWKGKQRAASWDARWLRMAALTLLAFTASSSMMVTTAEAAPAVAAADMHAGTMLTQDTWSQNVGKGIW